MSFDRWKTCLIVWATLLVNVGYPIEELPFSVPDGFIVQRVAEDRLAHDCFCMTLDGAGRPVVSGPGYLRTLVDDDGDGVYDRGVEWTREVKQGAQGLWVDGKSLYWVSDGGLWRSEDTDGDLVANARAQRLLELPTGGEHDCHAIKRGPDGCWYLIAGNFASTVGRLATDSNAPVLRPRAGTLWRMSPDFARRGVWAHGMRNAYDFDFLPDGQPVTYDSDDEREATLPWYRPTRVLVLSPGSDAGWCGSAWKDDDYRVTMPLVLARLGRGSPTGVVTYEHRAFPERYRDAVFVLDWTFGRVIAIYPSGNLKPDERIPNRIPSEVFMEPNGTAGFAPTSACVAPDGSLLICVGGRGTVGALYRISYAPESSSLAPRAGDPLPNCFATAIEKKMLNPQEAMVLESVIKAPSPWSAWSIAQWRPRVTPRVRGQLIDVALGRLPIDGPVDRVRQYRLRASQLLTRLGETIPADPGQSPAAWWLVGRQSPANRRNQTVRITASANANQALSRWEVHLGSSENRLRWEAAGLQRWPMTSTQNPAWESSPAGNALRQTWLWALSRGNSPAPATSNGSRTDSQIARLLFGTDRKVVDKELLDAIARRLSTDHASMSQREVMECLTCMQAALGERRLSLPLQTDAPADIVDGYRGLYTNQLAESARNNFARWALFIASSAKNQGWDAVHAESIRTIAMMEPSDVQCMNYLLDQITAESHPTSDLHMLCSLAQCAAPRSGDATKKTAYALADIVRKVSSRGLSIDNQWPLRINQLVARLVARDKELGSALIELPIPYQSEDLPLLNALDPATQDLAREKIRSFLRSAAPAQWSVPLLKFAAVGPIEEAFRETIQKGCEVDSLRQTCIGYLAQSPQAGDYDVYLNAIEQSDRSVWPDAWRGLSSLEAQNPTREFPMLARLISASFNTGITLPRQAIVDRIRQVAITNQRPAPPATEAWEEWNLYLQSQLDEAQLAALVVSMNKVDVASVLKSIEGLQGNPERGANLFQTKCALCHGSQSALGPSLSGVAKRFSREDLALAIYEPSRDVSDRYRAVRVRTLDDEVLTGMPIYTSVDGVTLQAADRSILRINQDQIAEKAFSTESIMPSGLLEDRSAQEIADLFAYLGTLQ